MNIEEEKIGNKLESLFSAGKGLNLSAFEKKELLERLDAGLPARSQVTGNFGGAWLPRLLAPAFLVFAFVLIFTNINEPNDPRDASVSVPEFKAVGAVQNFYAADSVATTSKVNSGLLPD